MDIDISKIRRLDFNLLLVFQQLLRHRRTTLVADHLGLSQSAISHSLARLRDAFGEPLFLRKSDGLYPTQSALRLAPQVDELIALAANALNATRGFDPRQSDRLFRIATNDYVATVLGPPLQARFATAAPRARHSMRFGTGAGALEALDKDSVDLVIGRFDAIAPDQRSVLLATDTYRVVARRAHPQFGRGGLSLDKYLALQHLLVSFEGDFKGTVDAALHRQGLARTIVGSVPMFLSALAIVGETDVIATVPARLAQRFAATFGLRQFELPFVMDGLTLSMVIHGRSVRDSGLAWLTGVIRELWPSPAPAA